ASALLADPEAARRFATAELAGLAAADVSTARLRDTLEAYLAEGASHKRAAQRLTLHEKTVEQRVRRAEELLGRPLAGRRGAVEAALVVHRLLGD
ncbi:helix-turn-helix domain-containing protein, partial [Sporichthya sp.]|uniref:helix-turn-helix domain-containing protein n=1 Tax=Sporichthya sp. TaxID=65475 RepID=UPI00182E6E4E